MNRRIVSYKAKPADPEVIAERLAVDIRNHRFGGDLGDKVWSHECATFYLSGEFFWMSSSIDTDYIQSRYGLSNKMTKALVELMESKYKKYRLLFSNDVESEVVYV